MTRSPLIAAVAVTCLSLGAGTAAAHSLDVATVEVRELAPGRVAVAVVVSTADGAIDSPVGVELPAGCAADSPETLVIGEGQLTTRWLARCDGPLAGGSIAVRWTRGAGNAMVRVHLTGGAVVSRLVTSSEPRVSLATDRSRSFVSAVRRYFELGVRHIAGGIDHLLFVFGLILLCRRRSILIATVTAFTVGHSVTLGLATLGLVSVPTAPVEAVIALSIVFVAVELARRADGSAPMRRRPFVFAGAFGLLHGLGFAGALTELGVAGDRVAPALLGFNLGVEAGQLVFVAAVLAIGALGKRVVQPPVWTTRALAYPMGAVSAMWLFDRVAAF